MWRSVNHVCYTIGMNSTVDARLVQLQTELWRMPCRILPLTFDAESSFVLGFPIAETWQWDSITQALLHMKPHGVMMRLPLFWQLEAPLWRACREVRAPIFLNDPENVPVGAAALLRGGIDTIVTETRDVPMFIESLHQEHAPQPKHWLLVHRPTDSWDNPTALNNCSVYQEVHLFPGFPFLYQCEALMESHGIPTRYHLVENHHYDLEKHQLATVASDDIPSLSLAIPRVIHTSVCSCGKSTYAAPI